MCAVSMSVCVSMCVSVCLCIMYHTPLIETWVFRTYCLHIFHCTGVNWLQWSVDET